MVEAVSGLIDAINRRDADALTIRCAPRVRFTSAVELRRQTYFGQNAVRSWMAQLHAAERDGRHPRSRIELARVRTIDRDTIMVAGDMCIADERIGPFVALVVYENGLVSSAHAFFGDEHTLDRLGYAPNL